MGLGRKPPEPAPEAEVPSCGCAERVAELEEAVAALARAVVRTRGAPDVYEVPGRGVVDNRPDAAVIRTAAARNAPR